MSNRHNPRTARIEVAQNRLSRQFRVLILLSHHGQGTAPFIKDLKKQFEQLLKNSLPSPSLIFMDVVNFGDEYICGTGASAAFLDERGLPVESFYDATSKLVRDITNILYKYGFSYALDYYED